jgi:hypothetical protein
VPHRTPRIMSDKVIKVKFLQKDSTSGKAMETESDQEKTAS